MDEKKILQATLRDCNTRLVSILRSLVTSFKDLVRIGSLVERDFHQAKQNQSVLRKEKKGSHTSSMCTLQSSPTILTVNCSINHYYTRAVIDSGSSFCKLILK